MKRPRKTEIGRFVGSGPSTVRTTVQVANLLHVPDWRIKNFAAPAYGLAAGTRIGNQRKVSLYTFPEVIRIAIACVLERAGFSPSIVGTAVKAVSDFQIDEWMNSSAVQKGNDPPPKYLFSRKKDFWHVISAQEYKNNVEDFRTAEPIGLFSEEIHPSIFFINVSAIAAGVCRSAQMQYDNSQQAPVKDLMHELKGALAEMKPARKEKVKA